MDLFLLPVEFKHCASNGFAFINLFNPDRRQRDRLGWLRGLGRHKFGLHQASEVRSVMPRRSQRDRAGFRPTAQLELHHWPTLHLPFGEVLTVFAQEHAEVIVVNVEGPFKDPHYR